MKKVYQVIAKENMMKRDEEGKEREKMSFIGPTTTINTSFYSKRCIKPSLVASDAMNSNCKSSFSFASLERKRKMSFGTDLVNKLRNDRADPASK